MKNFFKYTFAVLFLLSSTNVLFSQRSQPPQNNIDTLEMSDILHYGTYTNYFDSMYKFVDFSSSANGILYDRVVPIAGLTLFNQLNPDTSSYWHFIQAYSELKRASLSPSAACPLSIEELQSRKYEGDNASIGILNFDGRIDISLLKRGLYFVKTYLSSNQIINSKIIKK